MKSLRQLLLLSMVAAICVITSCGKDGGSDDVKTEKELVIEALAGTWNLDAGASMFANTGLDGSGISVTFTETGFSLTGDIVTYVSGGSYTVSEEGTLSDVSVDIAAEGLELSGDATVTINDAKDQITVTFSTQESESRVSGLGDFKFVFNKAS